MSEDEAAISQDSSDDDDADSHITGVDQDMSKIMKDLENEADDPDDLPLQSDKRSRKAKALLTEFAQLSTTHGISHMGEAHTKKVLIFWSCCLLLCAGGFGYLFSDTLIRYLQFETNVEISMESRERYFPAVTICNLCPFKRAPLMKVPELAALVYAFEFGIKDQKKEELLSWPSPPPECDTGYLDCKK